MIKSLHLYIKCFLNFTLMLVASPFPTAGALPMAGTACSTLPSDDAGTGVKERWVKLTLASRAGSGGVSCYTTP